MHNKDSEKLPAIHTDSYALGQLAPLRLFVIIIASIFFAEVIAMLVVHVISPLSYYQTTLLDAGIMVMMIFPILFQFSFRPLIQQIERLRQTKQRLQQEKELQQRFFNSVDIMIAYLDREFNFIRVNDAYARASEGHSPNYFKGKNHFVLYPHPENQQIFQRVVETGEAYYAHEKAFEYPDQPERGVTYWNWSVQPVRDGTGNVEGLVLSLLDVTTKRRAEEQLREMALFPTLNPNAALQVGLDGRVRKSNPAAHQMGLGEGICLFEAIPDLNGLDLSACVAAGSTLQVDETRLGEQILQWTVRGVCELDLAFLYSNDITARKRSEEAVRLLSSVVEQTADTVVITDPNGVIEYVNPAFEQLTGYSKEEALGGTPRVLKSGIHDAQFYKKLWGTVRSGQAFHSEITNRKRNGALFHEAKTITPLRNGKGEITHFVATGKDITERKQAEQRLRQAYDDLEIRVQERTEELRIANSELKDENKVRRQAEAALQQSEERLKRAQEIAHLGSWELDLLNDQLTWSDEVYRIFGLQPHEFAATYEAFLEAIHPDDRAAVNDAYSGSIRDGKDSYEIEHRVVKWSTGEIRVVHEKCEHFRDETGRIIRSVGMVHDITERKKAEEALRRSEALLLQTGEIAEVGGWELDLQTSTLRWSLETYRIHEVDPSLEPDLTNAINFYTPAVRSTIRTAVERAIEFGQHYDLELPLITASGKKIWIRTTGQPEFRDDKCVRLFGIFQDITERKQAQEKLQQLNAELEQRVAELQTLMDVAPVGIA
ncbi:MAG: PAS domain S-box protein, partial [Byssovorax cruenta]